MAVPLLAFVLVGMQPRVSEATSQPSMASEASQPGIMLTGDSVPMHLGDRFTAAAAARGWRLFDAAKGNCPVTAETVTNRVGKPRHPAADCPGTVPEMQDSVLAQEDPTIVVWWDRWSLSNFVTSDGSLYVTMTRRFWVKRKAVLRLTVDHFAANGARVLFVATEPPGKGMLHRCTPERCSDWVRWQIAHYHDATRHWNRMLRSFASNHPRKARFLSITGRICHRDVTLCDDTTPDGHLARYDGTHYSGQGRGIAVRLVLNKIATLLQS